MRIFWCGLLLAVSLVVGVGAMSATSGMEYEAGIAGQVRGTAHRPFVYRQLVPTVIRAVLATGRAGNWMLLEQRILESGWIKRFERLTGFEYTWWHAGDLIPIFLSAGISLLCVIAFAFVFRAFVEQQIACSEAFSSITSAVTVYLLVHMNREGVYSYDYPLLLLFTLALALMSAQAWRWYYPVFLLATVNKETTILLILVFAVFYARRLPVRDYLGHLALQSAGYLGITIALRRAFADSPGGSVEWHLFDHNAALLLNPEDSYGLLAFATIFTLLLLRGWSDKPLFLRRASVVFWPLFGLTVLFGWMDELRDYYEFYVVAMPLVAMTVARDVLGQDVVARDRTSGAVARAS